MKKIIITNVQKLESSENTQTLSKLVYVEGGDNMVVSDGYHTLDELYEHRFCLFIALMKSRPEISWRARYHQDGTGFLGWFVAGMHLPTGDISYHLPDRLWELLDGVPIETLENASKWDGHTSLEVLDRLNHL